MLNDAVNIIAAVLCGEGKHVFMPVTLTPALNPVFELLLMLSSDAETAGPGEIRVRPIPRVPDKQILRFRELPAELFLLFAGLAAKINVIFRVETVPEGIDDETLDTLCRAMGRVMVYARRGEGVALSAFSADDSLDPSVEVSPVFAAGVVLGAALAAEETSFAPGAYLETEEVKAAVAAINRFGGETVTDETGRLTVRTLRYTRFHPKTRKRLRGKPENKT